MTLLDMGVTLNEALECGIIDIVEFSAEAKNLIFPETYEEMVKAEKKVDEILLELEAIRHQL